MQDARPRPFRAGWGRVATALMLVALAVAGCGGGSDTETVTQAAPPSPTTDATGDQQAVSDVVKAFFEASASSNAGTACGYLTESVKKQVTNASGAGSCEEYWSQINQEYTADELEQLRNTSANVQVNGDSATATYTGLKSGEQKQISLQKQSDGSWKISQLALG